MAAPISTNRAIRKARARAGRPWLVGAAVAWLCAACGPTPDEQWQMAETAMARGEMRTATIHLKSLLQVRPDDGPARAALGRAEFALGDALGAEKEIRRAIALGERDPQLRFALVETLLAQGRFSPALEELGDAADAAEGDFRVLLLAGRAYSGTGDLGRAEARYRAAMAAAPDETAPIVATATLLLETGRTQEGDALVEAALARDPACVPAMILKGRRLAQTHGFAEAAAYFRQALARAARPGDRASVLVNLAEAELAMDDDPGASDAIRQLRALAPADVLTRYLDARLRAQSGDYAGAALALQEIMAEQPDFMPAEQLLGVVQYLNGNFEQAAMHISRAVGAGSANPFLVRLLAELRLQQNRPDQALQALLPSIRQGPGAVFDRRLLILAGEASLRLGDTAGAAAWFRQGGRDHPEDDRFRLGEISARLASGDTDAARRLLAAVRVTPGNRLAVEYLTVVADLAAGDYSGARGLAVRLAAENPAAPWAHMLAATVQLALGDRSASRAEFQAVLQLEPASREALINLARLDFQDGDGAAGEARLRRVIAANPADFRPRVLLAEWRLATGRTDEALAEARDAVRYAPDAPEAANLLGRIAAAAGRWEEARQSFLRITVLDPRNARAWLNLAQATQAAGSSGAVAQSVEKALAVAPRDPDVLQTAGDMLMQVGRPAEALDYYKRAYALAASAGAAMRACRAARAVHASGSCSLLARWLSANPGDLAAQLFQAAVDQASGDTAAAIDRYESVLRADPAHAVALNNLAWLYFETGDARAMATAERALAAQPGSAPAMDTLGWIELRKGDRSRGLALISDAAERNPADPEIQYHLAYALSETGAVDEARRTLAAVLAAAPDFPSRSAAEALLRRIDDNRGGADG